MSRKLLDTTFLIHYWGGVDAIEEYLSTHEETAEFITTAINLKEIVVGRRLQGVFDRTEIRSTFEWVEIVPFDSETVFLTGQLESSLQENPDINQDKINSAMGDLLIAAVARQLEVPIVTRNETDFALFDGVDVETY
ncbi:MAG: type II toxin-antitoxin system VapC family toxin [Halobacteriales archaeon]